jgi:hypothetical protein
MVHPELNLANAIRYSRREDVGFTWQGQGLLFLEALIRINALNTHGSLGGGPQKNHTIAVCQGDRGCCLAVIDGWILLASYVLKTGVT